MKSEAKKVKDMLKTIDQISSDISSTNDLRTREITEKLRANKKKCTDMLANSYNQAFNVQD